MNVKKLEITRRIRPVSIQFGKHWYRNVARDEEGQISIGDNATRFLIFKEEIDDLIEALKAMQKEPT